MAIAPDLQPSDIEVYYLDKTARKTPANGKSYGNFDERNTQAKGSGKAMTSVSKKSEAMSKKNGYTVC